MPGIHRTEFVVDSVSGHRPDHQQTDILQQGGPSEELGEREMGPHVYSQHQHTPISTLASAPCMKSDVSLRTQAGSSEAPPRFEAHVPQTALAQFHSHHFSFVCLQTKPTGHAHSRRLSPHSHKDEEGKSQWGESRASIPRARSKGFWVSDPLAQLVESRLSTGRLLQPGPEEGTSRLVTLCSWTDQQGPG